MAYGYNIVCFFSGDFGLSSYARHFVKAFEHNNVPYCIINVSLPNRNTDTKDFQKYLDKFSDVPKYDINVFIFGADLMNGLLEHLYELVDFQNKFNVYVPFWEMANYSTMFKDKIGMFDMVLAPTDFIKYGISNILIDTYLEKSPVFVQIPNHIKKEKTDVFKFYYSFDIGSSIHRKNPFSLLKAFDLKFKDNPDVKLILKFKGDNDNAFVSYVRTNYSSSNIEFVSKTLSYLDTIELMSSADCYVSTHRSEGLGLGLMEAMSMGIPCIATGYGGNLDFMNNFNSMLVPYNLIPVECPLYNSMCDNPNVWADINVNALSECMEEMKNNVTLRKKLIDNGKKTIQKLNSEFLKAEFINSIKNVYQRSES